MTNEYTISGRAVAKYIRISPTKVQRVLNQVRGRTYEEALILLEILPYRACAVVWKVIQSAASNTQDLYDINKQNLFIEEIFVTPGPILKRFRPRAQGRGYTIKKPMSHITAILSVKN